MNYTRGWEVVKGAFGHSLFDRVKMSTMAEADVLCDRLAITDRGKLIALDAPEPLKTALGRDIVTLRTTPAVADPRALFANLGVQTVSHSRSGTTTATDWSLVRIQVAPPSRTHSCKSGD